MLAYRVVGYAGRRRSRGESLQGWVMSGAEGHVQSAARRMLAPLALAQFICSYAGSNMNVMITDMSEDLGTSVQGIQVAITFFLLVMAALMIPASKLTDRFGRKRLFIAGLTVYGVGALISAFAPNLGVLIIGYSILEGVGTALLIPPVYILTTLHYNDVRDRARAFGIISALGGLGAATGPLIGGLITSAIDWRAAFVFQCARDRGHPDTRAQRHRPGRSRPRTRVRPRRGRALGDRPHRARHRHSRA